MVSRGMLNEGIYNMYNQVIFHENWMATKINNIIFKNNRYRLCFHNTTDCTHFEYPREAARCKRVILRWVEHHETDVSSESPKMRHDRRLKPWHRLTSLSSKSFCLNIWLPSPYNIQSSMLQRGNIEYVFK